MTKYEGAAKVPTVEALGKSVSLVGKTVWFIPITNALATQQLTAAVMKKALAKLGANLRVCDGKALATTIAQCLNSAVSQGADMVITSYVDYALVPAAYNNVISHHIPVVVGGQRPSGGKTSDSSISFVNFDNQNFLANRLLADAIIKDSKGAGNVLFVRIADSAATKDGSDTGINELKQHCSGCTVYTVDTQTAQSSKIASTISAELVRHPDINYVASYDSQLPQVTSGIATAGKTSKVRIATWSGSVTGLQSLSSSDKHFVDIGGSTVSNGLILVDAMLHMMTGQKVPTPGTGIVRAFSKSNISGLSLTQDAYKTTTWYGVDVDDLYNAYYTAWGLSS